MPIRWRVYWMVVLPKRRFKRKFFAPQFFEIVNKPFLEGAIRRGDDIALATIPLRRSEIISPVTGGLNGMYAFELKFLVENGVTPNNIPVQKWSEIQGWFG